MITFGCIWCEAVPVAQASPTYSCFQTLASVPYYDRASHSAQVPATATLQALLLVCRNTQSLSTWLTDRALLTISKTEENTLLCRYPPLDGSSEGAVQHPSTRVWVLLYLAQHHVQMGNVSIALAAIDEAIAHTPTVIELHVCRAQILKRAGAYKGKRIMNGISRACADLREEKVCLCDMLSKGLEA